MLTVNIDLQDRLINGQIGTIKYISKGRTNNITKIYVKFDDAKAGLKKMSTDFFAKTEFMGGKAESNIRIPSKSSVPLVIRRTRFLLMLAWACTVHKLQGLKLEEIVVNFDLLKQKQFKYGQMYVALRRVMSLRGLHLTGEFKAASIRSDPRAIQEYHRMRIEIQLLPLNLPNTSNKFFTFTLLNVRSLNKHSIDISCDKRLRDRYFKRHRNTNFAGSEHRKTGRYLLEFYFFHNKSNDRYQSLAFCPRDSVEIDTLSQSPGRSSFLACKAIMDFPLKALLLYCQNNGNLALFYQQLAEINADSTFNIILGDFNINFI